MRFTVSIDLPWECASSKCKEFVDFIKHSVHPHIFRIPGTARKLIIEMLQYSPSRRLGLSDIVKTPWFKQRNPLFDNSGACCDPQLLFRYISSNQSTQFSW